DLQIPAIQRLQPDDGFEKRRLTDPVGADDPDDPVAGKGEGESVDERTIPETLLQILCFEHDRAEPRPGRDLDFFEVQLPVCFRHRKSTRLTSSHVSLSYVIFCFY